MTVPLTALSLSQPISPQKSSQIERGREGMSTRGQVGERHASTRGTLTALDHFPFMANSQKWRRLSFLLPILPMRAQGVLKLNSGNPASQVETDAIDRSCCVDCLWWSRKMIPRPVLLKWLSSWKRDPIPGLLISISFAFLLTNFAQMNAA
jgi:hypothetical protein